MRPLPLALTIGTCGFMLLAIALAIPTELGVVPARTIILILPCVLLGALCAGANLGISWTNRRRRVADRAQPHP
jgi:hypothetical protein